VTVEQEAPDRPEASAEAEESPAMPMVLITGRQSQTQTRTASKTFRGAAAVSYMSARLKKAAPSVSPTPKF